jgi:hypothetical protein
LGVEISDLADTRKSRGFTRWKRDLHILTKNSIDPDQRFFMLMRKSQATTAPKAFHKTFNLRKIISRTIVVD